MRLLVVFLISLFVGQSISVGIGLLVERHSTPYTGLVTFIACYFAMFWVAWRFAVRITEPRSLLGDMKNGRAEPGAILLGAYAAADDLWGYSTLLAAGVQSTSGPAHLELMRSTRDHASHSLLGELRPMILNSEKCLAQIGVKRLNPGPSGEDVEEVSQPRDVGSLRSALVRAGAVVIGALKLDKTTPDNWSAPPEHMDALGGQHALKVAAASLPRCRRSVLT